MTNDERMTNDPMTNDERTDSLSPDLVILSSFRHWSFVILWSFVIGHSSFTRGGFPMSERTPLYEAAAQAGAVFAETAGWLVPAHYGEGAAEYYHTRRHAGFFDVSHHGQVELSGPDAVGFLHNLCTNDINRLAPGTGCEAFLTTAQAKVVARALVYRGRLPDGRDVLWLDVGPGLAGNVLQHLDRYLITEQVELAERTRELAQLHLAGPAAPAVVKQALGEDVPDLAELQHVERTLPGGAAGHVRRHDPLGVPGYDLVCPAGQAGVLWQVLVAAGARPAGLDAYEVLRVEAGTPVNGTDIDETQLPQELGRTDRAVSFTKGCYIGQETVARIRTYGHVNRSLVGLKLAGSGTVPAGARLLRDGKEVGHITSAVESPRLGTAIALAYVRRGSQEPGTVLEVEGGRRTAIVAALPFAGT
jgi:glycine cleavage system T protein